MTDEQLDALEDWIVALIRDEDRASVLTDRIRLNSLKQVVREVFGIEKGIR